MQQTINEPVSPWRLQFLVALLLAQLGAAWRTHGVLPTYDRFVVYVGKFCFNYDSNLKDEKKYSGGRFQFKVQVPAVTTPREATGSTGGKLYLMAFDDEDSRWKMIRDNWGSLTCQSMINHACEGCVYLLDNADGETNRTVEIFYATRPRFWYFTFVACGVSIEYAKPIEYEIHAEAMWHGSYSEFGVNERGSLGLQVCAAFGFVAVVFWIRDTARRATGAEALRSKPLLRTLLLSSLASTAGAACLALHFAVYSVNGVGLVVVEVVGQISVCCAKGLLTLLQLLTAKGWALFYEPGELSRRRLLSCILAGVVIMSFSCEIHADYFRDWSTTLYLYESGPGAIILFLNFVLYLEAWRSMRETYQHETSPEVRAFYVMIFLAASLYFLTLPVMTVMALMLEPWVRAKYVARAEVASRAAATLILCYCLRPSNLESMVNARVEDGLDTIGELRDDIEEDEDSDNDYGIERPSTYARQDNNSETAALLTGYVRDPKDKSPGRERPLIDLAPAE